MGFYRSPIILCIVGIAIALIPTVFYIAYSQEVSFLKTLEIEIMSGVPAYLGLSFAGLIVTLLGLITFVRSIRRVEGPSILYSGRLSTSRIAIPTQVRRPTVQQPPVKLIEEVVESINKELEDAMKRITMKQPTPHSTPQQEAPQKISIKVITAGMDEVCPSCGAINPLGQKVCTECGADIYIEDPNFPSCPVCGAPLKDPQKVDDKICVCKVCFSELEIPKKLSKKL